MIASEITSYPDKISNNISTIAKPYFRYRADNWVSSKKLTIARDEFIKKMNSLGWKKIGTGAYSTIYQNPNKNYVMKVTDEPDSGFDKFVGLIHKYPNLHFPIVSDRKNFTMKADVFTATYSIYLIEKLYPVPINISLKYAKAIRSVIMSAEKPNEKIDLNILFQNRPPKFLLENPSLVQALEIIGWNGSEEELDIKADNLMKRKDGTLVITDPYSC
jgi:hypothetical protein